VSLDGTFKRVFGDDEPTSVGSGWASGVVAVVLGTLSLAAVLCIRFPALLVAPSFRSLYPLPLVRVTIEIAIGVAFLTGIISIGTRRRKVLGATGVALAILAAMLGGGHAPVGKGGTAAAIGLDWFALNLLLLGMVFVPIERAFPQRPTQLVFRSGWTTDGVHFLVSHLLVQGSTLLTIAPAAAVMRVVRIEPVAEQLPVTVQVLAIVFLVDLVQYFVHRAFHTIPVLWRFHAIHHSSEELDWIAGSRLHLVDAITVRAITFIPIHALGFSRTAVGIYLVCVSFHAVFIHANVRFRFGALEQLIVTPRFHHWHHARTPIDKNFAVHFPWLDRVFGTFHFPAGEWPAACGGDAPIPSGWLAQLVRPFARKK
jgi:sterol desaturase/sphingolipid hydroxylase (fatty acid hydroxylase superfamily)